MPASPDTVVSLSPAKETSKKNQHSSVLPPVLCSASLSPAPEGDCPRLFFSRKHTDKELGCVVGFTDGQGKQSD